MEFGTLNFEFAIDPHIVTREMKIIIAIDGHSSTGKSTVAKMLASYLNYIYVDSGAMYRAVTLYAMQNGFITQSHFNTKGLIDALPEISLSFKQEKESGKAEMFLNGKNVEKEIRSIEVSQYVSQVAQLPEVRKKMVQQQQAIGKDKGVVMDGRDIGSVVFPQAELKIFLTASAEERAQRRYLEYQNKGENIDYDTVYQNVVERDRIDSTRKASPLTQTYDAIVVDNTFTNKEDQFYTILQLAKDRIAGRI